jgi:hypothetical protein
MLAQPILVLDRISSVLGSIRWDTDEKIGAVPTAVGLGLLRKEWWKPSWWGSMFSDPDRSRSEQGNCLRMISEQFAVLIQDEWPLSKKLVEMIKTNKGDDPTRWVGPHVVAVLACLNSYLPEADATKFFVLSQDKGVDSAAHKAGMDMYTACWQGDVDGSTRAYFGQGAQLESAKAFIRVAALYHDIGKTISDDRHVSRGVHLIEDVIKDGRRSIEALFDDFWDAERLLALLKHHDIFGCLCTGEASLPALADMIHWIGPAPFADASGKGVIAQVSFLDWLNIADSDASLLKFYGGITTVEAFRYLRDWNLVVDFLAKRSGAPARHDEFAAWAMTEATRADRTIERIARLVATCCRMITKDVAAGRELLIKALVQRELLALHGPRFQRFCWRFARFAKLDYGLGFFAMLMDDALRQQRVHDPAAGDDKQVAQGIRVMIAGTCSILARIVEEYGHLVDDDRHPGLRLGVDMSKLTLPKETGLAICEALRSAQTSAGALRWIVGEISIWLYD